jgi:hypothetical protein
MTGEAGYITRIEAFIDLLDRRRQNVLSGCWCGFCEYRPCIIG